jgi:uncharacterized protein (DUF58 family)
MTQTAELLKKVKKIEIRSRGLSNDIFSGKYLSAFKGKGMAFSEVREYNYGDSIRNIDWNVTARYNRPFVKLFDEERELTVMLLVDVSGSNDFGTFVSLKKELITEIAAVLAFSAIQNNDKVGIIFFSNKIEKFIPPKKGVQHILKIIRELIDFQPEEQTTHMPEALKFLTNAIKKRCTAFILSDFFDDTIEDALKITNQKHDLVAIRVYDQFELEMPDAGLIRMSDAETGKEMWIDSSVRRNRQMYNQAQRQRFESITALCRKAGIDMVDVKTGQDYIKPLIKLFNEREARR